MTLIQLIIISRLLLGCCQCKLICSHGPLARCVKLRFAHAPWMPGTFPLPSWFSDPDINHGKCVTPGNRWRGKRSRHSRRMLNPQCYIPGKRPMSPPLKNIIYLCSIKQLLSLAITGNRLGFSSEWSTSIITVTPSVSGGVSIHRQIDCVQQLVLRYKI